MLCLFATPAGVLAGTPSTTVVPGSSQAILTAAGGNNNKGDVWLDNAGQPSGPGHEMDPHLACAPIILWGDKLADPSGTFTIDGWPPSGTGASNQAWPGTVAHSGNANWTYSGSGSQDILTNDSLDVMTPQGWAIDAGKLVAHAIANGDAPVNKQGFHFKLQFSQDPQKHKVFWVNCAPNVPNNPPLSNCVPTKTVDPTGIVSTQTVLNYTVRVANNSATAGPCSVDDVFSLAGGATFSVVTPPSNSTVTKGSVTGTNPQWNWQVGTLQPGESATLTMSVRALTEGTITNTASVPQTQCIPTAAAPCTSVVHTPVVAPPTFTLAKSVSPSSSPVPVGTPLAYTITLTNTSNKAGDPGPVTDQITTTGGLTYHLTSGPTASQGSAPAPSASGLITWTPGSVAANTAITLKYTLVPDTTGGIKNTAVNKNTNCDKADNPTCTTNTDVVNYKLSKSVSPSGPVKVGTPLTYTVTLTNLSSTVAGDPGTVNDTPSTTGGAVFAITTQPSVSQGAVNPVAGAPTTEFAWAPGPLAAGGVATLSMVLTPTSAGNGPSPTVVNTAFDTKTNCATPMVAACTTNTPLTNYSLAKTVTPTGTVTVGSTLTYTVTITNLTTQAGDPGAVSDFIKADGVTYTVVSGPTGNVTGTNPNFSWTPGTLNGGESKTTTLVIKVTGLTNPAPANPTILNTAFNPNTNCNVALVPACTPITPVTDFLMSKTVSPAGAATIGSTLTYTVKITNTTATAGDPGTVTDTITANGVQYTVTGGPSTAHGTVTGSPPTYTWTVGQLAGNQSATLTLVIKVTGVTAGTSSPTIVNTAVDVNTNCPTANNPDCTTNTPLVVLTLTKTVNKTTAALNDTLTYTITVGNTGAAPASNVLVDDIFGGTAGFQVNDGTLGTTNSFAGSPAVPVTKIGNGHYQWTYAVIKPGDTATVVFTAKIELPFTALAAPSGTITLTNTVSVPTYVTGVGTYVNPGNNPPPVTVSTVAPYNGGVQGCSTSNGCGVPNTGTSLNVTLAGFLFLGGLGLILVGALARKREDTTS
jgi:uncharacterized repeat protein (TIGR01451 family)